MAILPLRPLPLDEDYLRRVTRRSWRAFALFLVVSGGFSFGSVSFTRQCLEERALWARGTPGAVRSISGEVRKKSKFGVTLFYDYKLDVEYADARGDAHRGRSEFELVWTPLAGDVNAAQVRYDPAQPDRFVLSSPIEAGLPRWGLPILMGLLGALMIFALFENRRSHSKLLHGFALCAQDGEETLVPLRSAYTQKGSHYVTFQFPDRDKPVTAVLDQEPLVLTQDGVKHLVVLRSPRDRAEFTILRESLAPFALDPETKARLLAQALGQRAQ
jgi:hypothetical protein